MDMHDQTLHLATADGGKIAYRHEPGKHPGLLYLGGFHSDMEGSKASFLHARAAAAGIAFTRFDYRGHGSSSGRFEDGTIGLWTADALTMLDRVCAGPTILVGSSMGGWIAMLLARARPERARGLVLIAPAPDFPRRLMMPEMPAAAVETLRREGRWDMPSAYDEAGYPITLRLVEESADHEILDGPPIPVGGPVHILQGTADETVPLSHAMRALSVLEAPSVTLEAIKGGDHRLSTTADLARLWTRVGEVRDALDVSG